jgi:CDP-2,3-bis-(O-geranylgeranyl)-sn-glycerol synthase
MLELNLLLLLFTANSAPVVARNVLGPRWQSAIDGGRMMADGQPLLGHSKTWRGLFAALLLTTVLAVLLDLSWTFGLIFGASSMFGDLFSSFIKRRLRKPASSQAIMLDQLPEALLPLIVGRWLLDYSWTAVLLISLLFMLSELLISPLLFKLGVRKKPY